MRQRTAIVIGGGIGGLTAALALDRRGWSVTVLERTAAPAASGVRAGTARPVRSGAGIALAPNAQRALDTLGLGDAVRAMAAWQGAGELRLPGGRRLARTDNAAAVRRFGGPVVVAHRAELLALLAGRLPDGALRTGATAELVDPGDPGPGGRPARVRITAAPDGATGTGATAATDGPDEELTADLVVGADGIHSAVRRAVFPGHPEPRYAGFTAWRFVVPAPDRPCTAHETWGPGGLWGTVPLPDGRIYAYATAAVPPGGRAADDERAELLRRFGTWHHPVPDLIAAADPAAVLRNDVRTAAAPPPAFHRGRVALLGDAVHPMTPNLGQGGCQAMEDAVVLAQQAAPDADLAAALAEFTRQRLPRTMDVVRRAERIGRLTTWRSRPACALRAALMAATARLTPDLALRALDGIADWRPEGPTYAAGTRGTRTAAQPKEHE
ncbi:FAD-dependent oxidoreductase [Streptomyces lydicus]|uniref:Monooxygenase n=1 Tax=Streptomyces lydicus TaxID=47763 RepID=A0A1D7VKI3_9ACTN|nr:FAD-dependent oxidoreductase [Streptomyces lydicus]AOP47241.1 monooxygenase [Streptomyces lydicus]